VALLGRIGLIGGSIVAAYACSTSEGSDETDLRACMVPGVQRRGADPLHLEAAALPSATRVVAAVRETLSRG
jgi:hypothetical protein